jgi:uncharacterized protein involved in exopolysaccharide biosynthesis
VEPRSAGLNDADDTLLGLGGVWLLVGFALRSLKRRWRLALGCFVGTMVLAGLFLLIMPKTYRIDTRILSHPSYIIPSLTHPNRSIPIQASEGTRGAVEIIKSRENLLGIITDTDLINGWQQTRIGLRVVIDSVRRRLFGELSQEDMKEALLTILEDKLWATVDKEVIIITLTWHDPVTGLEILKAAQKRFLDGSYARELNEIQETIRILEQNVAVARNNMEAAADRLETVAKSHQVGRTIRRVGPTRPRAEPASEPGALLEAERDLMAKTQEIRRLEDSYDQRVRTAQAKLAEIRNALGPKHPDVINAVRDLEMQSFPPEALTNLRSEQAQLDQQVRRLQAAGGVSSRRSEIFGSLPDIGPTVDPDLERALQTYRQLETVYNELMDRLDNAQVEMDAARAGFGYRYVITLPPVFPRRPEKPQPAKVMIGALVAALALAALMALLADLRARRVLETWQIERLLGLRVLGELDER